MFIRRLILPAGLLGILMQAALASHTENAQPGPQHAPEDVVRIVMEALGHNDDPHENAGIETAFRFASPANKAVTGPLQRFIPMVRNPVYEPMLNFRSISYEEIRVDGNVAIQPVILTSSAGDHAGYFFRLSKQEDGPEQGAWMTDAVSRFRVPEDWISASL